MMDTSETKLLSKKAKKRKVSAISNEGDVFSIDEAKLSRVTNDESSEEASEDENGVSTEGIRSAPDFSSNAESEEEDEAGVKVLKEKDVLGDKNKMKTKKKKKAGVLYMATIPKTLTVAQIRQFMSQFGKVGRIYLQPETKSLKKGKKRKRFCEGWVEMEKKSVAKKISQSLNNTRIGYRKRSHLYDSLWNLKYLSGFKWTHLNERLEYERQVQKQRMMNEISQAKRETDAYAKAVAKARYLKNKGVLRKDDSEEEEEEAPEDGEGVEEEAKPAVPLVKNRDAFLSNIFAKKKS